MLYQRQSYTCPCCGGYLGEAAPPANIAKTLGNGHRRTLFEYLSKRVGEVVERPELMDALYSNRKDGGAMSAGAVVTVEIGRLRTKIEPFGWTIAADGNGRGHKVTYRLIPLEAGA